VICDTEKNIFYPVKDEDEIQIGNCVLQEEYRDGVCEIRITFIPVFPINKKPIRTNWPDKTYFNPFSKRITII